MSRVLKFLRNPLILVIPVVALLGLLWYQYTNSQLDMPVPKDTVLTNGGLDELDDRGFPKGWAFVPATHDSKATTQAGYNSSTSIRMTNSNDTPGSGNSTLASPLVPVESGQRYLYKGFYKSTVPFDLIECIKYKDGTSKQVLVARYTPSQQWTTNSYVLTAEDAFESLQFIYSFSAKGELQVDSTYLEKNPTNVYQPASKTFGVRLMSSLTSSDSKTESWSSTSTGSHASDTRLVVNNNESYLFMRVSNYKSGESKWQHAPVPVKPNQLLELKLAYRSNAPVDVVAEYILASGEHQFITIDTLLPVKEWTNYTTTFDVPNNTTGVVIATALHTNGTVVTKEYTLSTSSDSSPTTWKRPLTSITFDDGWQSSYTNGVSLLNKFGLKATFYINPASIDTPQFMSSDELLELRGSSQELASHGYEHTDLTTLSDEALNYQLERASQYFQQIHNETHVNFATPFGTADSKVASFAHKYYRSLRTTQSGINTRLNFDPYKLLVFYVNQDTPMSALSDAISQTKARNGWLILVYHRVDVSGDQRPLISPRQFQQQLELLLKSGTAIMTVSDALNEIDTQQ